MNPSSDGPTLAAALRQHSISVRGARTHNLKNIDLDIPRNQLVDSVLALPEDTRLMILAPLAREKKGEFLDVFADMQAQGYVRFRVNGQAYEADSLPTLKKTEKHDIDVVIDRVKVRPELKQRLAESFEAALRLASGRAIALEMDAPTSASIHSQINSALRT